MRKELSSICENFLVLIISYSLFNLGYALTWPFESPFVQSLGASPFMIGLIGSIGSLVLFLARILEAYAKKLGFSPCINADNRVYRSLLPSLRLSIHSRSCGFKRG